jgi:VWFA-related protein
MKINFSTRFVLMFSLIVMFLWLANSGCKGKISDPPAAETSSTQTPADQTPTTQPPATQPPATQPPATQPPATQPSAAQIKVSNLQIANGNVVLNNISGQSVSVQNTGSVSLTIGQIAKANPLALPFSIVSDNCSGKTVQPSAACSFNVQFNPTSQGIFNDSFDIPSDASNENSVTVAVTGSGKALRTVINQVKTDGCSTGILELIVAITDQNNAPLAGLTPGDFQLTENGVPQTITSVSAVISPVPASVGLTLDYTTSMASEISNVEYYSKGFVDILNADDEAAIIKFAQIPQLMTNFTGTKADLKTAISTTPTSIGRNDETRLYDALWFSVDTTAASHNNKAVVALTDGVDVKYNGQKPASVNTLDQVITHASGTGVAIYPIGLGTVDAVVLNRLANETGGQYFHIASSAELGDVYQSIRNILSGQYSIKYVSSLHGSSPSTLNIDVVSAGAKEGAFAGQFAGCP